MKKYSAKMKAAFINDLHQFIAQLLSREWEDMDDKLLMAVLSEIKDKIYDMLKYSKQEYKLSLTPAQALALRTMYLGFFGNDVKSYLGNNLFQLSNKIDQFYQ